MAPNEDLNKIREAARRLQQQQQQGSAQPPPSPRPAPPAPPRRAPDRPRPAPVAVPRSGHRLRGALWGVPTSLIVLWILGVIRFVVADGYQAGSSPSVGRAVGAFTGRLFVAVTLLAIVAALILGRLGVWLSATLAGIAGFSPALIPEFVADPSVRWTPGWLVQGCAELSATSAAYLRWVAFLAAPVLALVCLGKALRSG